MTTITVHHHGDDKHDDIRGETVAYSIDPATGALGIHKEATQEPFIVYAHGHWMMVEVKEVVHGWQS
jgi:hypothetical protein